MSRRGTASASNHPAFEPLEPRLLLDSTSFEQDGVVRYNLSSDVDELSLQYVIPALEVSAVDVDPSGQDVTRVSIEGAELIGDVGMPILPVVPATIVIPYGYEVATVDVVAEDRLELKGSYVIEQGTSLFALDGSYVQSDPPVYASADTYPEQTFEVVGTQYSRGVGILLVNLNPVEYVQATGELAYYGTLTLDVIFAPTESSGVTIAYRKNEVDSLADEVANPEALDTYARAGGGQQPLGSILVDPADTFDYVVITNEYIAGAVADYTIYDFVGHKQSLGYSVALVTVEDIYANYTGVDQPEQIRNFIIDAYNNWETDFVLLAGDTNVIPSRGLYAKAAGYTEVVPSDLYYQCLDGDYNYDGDEYWGEITDGIDGGDVDLMAEVYVGRVSAQDPNEMANWVYKTIAYENDPDGEYREKALMVGERMNFGGVSEFASSQMEEIRLGARTAGYSTVGFAADEDFTVDTLYDAEGTWPTSDLVDVMNAGTYGIYNHLGHGQITHVLKMNNDDVDALTNDNYFFVYTQACHPGNFTADSIGEHFTTSTRTGAVGGVFNSDFGWGQKNSTDGGSQRIARQFWDALFAEDINQMGVMNADSHEDNLWGIDIDVIRWSIYVSNLFGDPSLGLVEFGINIDAPSELPMAYEGEAYSFQLQPEYETGACQWEIVSGELPAGLTFNENTGEISGTPTETGISHFTVSVTDSALNTVRREFDLAVVVEMEITTDAEIPFADLGEAYSFVLDSTGGTADYTWSVVSIGDYSESDPGSSYVGGGVPMEWHADDASWKLELPWTFSFYGHSYDSVWVCSNGFLDFAFNSTSYKSSSEELIENVRIAVLWDDLRTDGFNEDIFVTETENYVVIRWQGRTYRDAHSVDFEVVLFPDGRIGFNYGEEHTGIEAGVGISAGNGVDYLLSSLNGALAVPPNTSLMFVHEGLLPAGIALDYSTGELTGTPTQLGQYDFSIIVLDSGIPTQSDLKSFTLEVVDLPQLTIDVPTSAVEGDAPVTGTVSIPTVLTENLVISLESLDTGEAAVDATVTVLAGELSADFTITIIDDADLDGVRDARITASADGYAWAVDTLSVADSESTTITLDLPDGTTEGDGPLVGTVTLVDTPTFNVVVTLTSDDETELIVPETVTVLAGQTSATFDVYVVDDDEIDGAQIAGMTAHFDGWTPGVDSINVLDNENLNLVITLPDEAWEGDGVLAGAGTVSISGTLPTDLVVTLESSDLGELAGAPSVTILAGETSATFDLEIINDTDPDGPQIVEVTATAAGFIPGASNMNVGDNEVADYVVLLHEGDYVESTSPAVGPESGGTATNWRGDDWNWELTLPWAFSFYGVRYETVWVNSNGYIDFAEKSLQNHNTTAELISNVRIAPMWDDLRTNGVGDNIYIDLSDPDAVGIRWVGSTYVGCQPVELMLTLYRDSSVRFDYLRYHRDLTPTIGISAGDGINYTLSSRTGDWSIDEGESSLFTLAGGSYEAGMSFAVSVTPRDITGAIIKNYNEPTALSAVGDSGLVELVPLGTSGDFIGGTWTGTVAVNTIDTGVVITADDGNGHFGSSVAFDVAPGQVAAFQWDVVPSPQTEGQSFVVTVTALDTHGILMTDFDGTVDLAAYVGSPTSSTIVITEADDYSPDYVEIQNVSGRKVDTSGWMVALNDAENNDINSVNSVLWTLPDSMASGELLYRTDDPYDNYWGSNISWDGLDQLRDDFPFGNDVPLEIAGDKGWVMIIDDEGNIVDFVVWGYSEADIVAMSVNIGGFNIIIGSEWSGDGVSYNITSAFSLQRIGDSDGNGPGDWGFVEETRAVQNTDLTVPFAGSTMSVSILPVEGVTFAGGVWTGEITVLDGVNSVFLIADDGSGHAGVSNTFNVVNLPPTVVGTEINEGEAHRSDILSVAIQFSSNVSASLDVDDLVLWNDTEGEGVDLSLAVVTFDAETNTAEWDLSAVEFSDGLYTATLVASGITDSGGMMLDGDDNGTEGGDYVLAFHRKFADADGNGKVNGYDLAIWQIHYDARGDNPDNSPATGDWNHDGKVDGGDLALWQVHYDPVGIFGMSAAPDQLLSMTEPGQVEIDTASMSVVVVSPPALPTRTEPEGAPAPDRTFQATMVPSNTVVAVPTVPIASPQQINMVAPGIAFVAPRWRVGVRRGHPLQIEAFPEKNPALRPFGDMLE